MTGDAKLQCDTRLKLVRKHVPSPDLESGRDSPAVELSSAQQSVLLKNVAAVVIGRNEGLRLQACLRALEDGVAEVVYVDSGSSDKSVEFATRFGATVVELDMSRPFTAARARNEGFESLRSRDNKIEYVQFIDGDCVLREGWLHKAESFLSKHLQYAVVCGRRREIDVAASPYNAVCDVEWDTPTGDALACGGDAMIRLDALQAVGGFNPCVIAGEEPELCVRLRQAGWKVMRLPEEMTWHDAGMIRFQQWWSRSQRAGYAYAQGVALHGRAPEHHWVRETTRCWFWACILPLATVALTFGFGWVGLLLLLLYAVVWSKTAVASVRRGRDVKASLFWASACLVGKFAELSGQVLFIWRSLVKAPISLIEYKGPAEPYA